jgi:hypothetical protein
MARRGDRPPIGLTWIMTWPLSAAFAALVFLAAEEIRHPAHDGAAAAPPPAVVGGPDWSAHFPDRIAAVDAALHKAALPLPKPVEDERGSGPLRWTHRLYQIDLPRTEQAQAESAIEAVRGSDPGLGVTAENTADGTDVRVGLDGLLVSTLRFRWVDPVTPKPPSPRVAVVIGPLGDDLRVARQVVAIEGPVALGVRPFRPFSREVAQLGRMFDRDIFVELDGTEEQARTEGAPPNAVPGPDLDALLASVPQAVGVAWQPSGGGKVQKPDKRWIAEVERRQLLFVGEHGKTGALRAPALIAESPPDAVAAQFDALLEKARSEGSVLAVGTPSDATLEALAHALPEWRAAEVELVAPSALAQPLNLSAR